MRYAMVKMMIVTVASIMERIFVPQDKNALVVHVRHAVNPKIITVLQ